MSEDLSAGVLVVTSSTGDADESSSIAVVDKITKTQNEDGVDIEKALCGSERQNNNSFDKRNRRSC
ncbi:MAG: hypothetical protein L6V93_07415 [Clostridiales bacterium]|nr:MAG: hypothetical protein L6V93_07415 [Clostridiales bacterium]